MADFQSSVGRQLAIGVKGDFATVNPYFSLVTNGDAVRADAKGVNIGNFAWVDDNGVAHSTKADATATARRAFVGRNGSVYSSGIQNLNAGASMTIRPGLAVPAYSDGDFLMSNDGAAAGTTGMKVFAKLTDGSTALAAAGTNLAGYEETDFIASTPAAVGSLFKASKRG